MRWWFLHRTIATAILLTTFITQITANAVFELKLDKFLNELGLSDEGFCCSGFRNSSDLCSENCLTKFRVCLNVYQQDININSPCTFGEKITPVLGENSVHFNESQLMKFNIESWQGTFSLIIEAWHQNESLDALVNGPVLVNRMATQRFLAVGNDWTTDVHNNDFSTIDYKFRVVCQENYYGPECRTWCRHRDDNFGHYTCDEDGNRVCLPGWEEGQNSYCSKPICRRNCKGMCDKPNECKCQVGWTGPNCDQCILYPGCLHGTCEKPWECLCKEGWGGLFCNQDLNYCTNNRPCRNGATCLNTAPGSYSCECPSGFNGTNCEIINDSCTNEPCMNGGTCLDTGNQGFVCQCPSGYSGRYCELSGKTCDDRPCMNGATCMDHATGFQCLCPSGYEGIQCERPINDCLTAPCRNGGSCVDEHKGFRCVCPVGYTGDTCESNINDCAHNPCYNQGKCVDEINSFACQCRPGFVGNLCQENVNDCAAIPCANGGTCIDGVNSVKCVCPIGWAGKFCTKKAPMFVSPCEVRPCQNGGYCREALELSSGFRCTCPHGYVGPRCTVLENSLVVQEARQTSEPMSAMQVVLIITFSVAVPVLALGFFIAIVCMKRRRQREFAKNDEEARKQNEHNTVQNATNNKHFNEKNMIFNALEYPVKPINTDPPCYRPSIIHVDPNLSYYSKNTLDSSYSIVPTRSTKTLNTDVSRSSLALRLEKGLDAYVSKSPCSEVNNMCKTPESCPTPSSVYLIENNYKDDSFIATEV